MMRIGEFAQATRESIKTIRYWEEQNLLEAQRSESGYRHFLESMAERVAFIRKAQTLGFRLDEIRDILELRAEGTQPCKEVRTALEEHLASVRERIASLEALEAELMQRLEWASEHEDPDCEQHCVYVTTALT